MASRIVLLFVLTMVIALSTVVFVVAADRWNDPRDYEPIVIKGENFIDFLDQPIKELYVYAYNAAANTWHPIPFQIDQKDDSSHFWVPVPNDTLDLYDELVFMAKDMGDKAPDGSYWIDDSDSRNYNRVEITAIDSITNKQGYVYFYRSKTLATSVSEKYVSYKPDAQGKGADTLIAKTYVESHNAGGIPTEWILLEGNRVNILDRLKVRVTFPFLGSPFTANEALLEYFFLKVEKKIGPVRVLREVFWYINLGGYKFLFSLPLQYYPFNIESGGVSGSLSTNHHVNYIRQSFDLNPNASGMKLYNPNNLNGILIDGQGDSDGIINTIEDAPAVNWWLITGSQGSYALVFRLFPIGQTRTLYYHDNKTVLNEDADTGDRMSWGDTGIQINGTDIAGKISFTYKAFYLGANKQYSLGDSLATNYKKPLTVSTSPNYYVPVELAFFKALESDGNVVVEWMTQSESNNYGFEIQRKTPSNSTWEIIAQVKGQGTTTTPHKYSYNDGEVPFGIYYYRLRQIDFDGSFEFSNEIRIVIGPPTSFALDQNYPNPFNPETVIRYRIPELDQASVPVELKIYNLIGDEVKTLVQKDQGMGYYSILWDGKNEQGEVVAAGTYIYRFRAGGFTKTNKMLLLR